MDKKSLELLEFQRVREIIAGYTVFSTGRGLAMNLEPVSECERVSSLLKQSAEARRLLSLQPDFSVGSVSDIRESVGMAARNKVLDPPNLVEIHQTLSALRQLRGNLWRLAREAPLLWDIASGITELHDLEKDISSRLTPAGEILDSASEKLSTVRHKLRENRERLLSRFDAIIKSSRVKKLIQEPIITEREGRYVIPVKIEFHKEIKGIVHDVSNTGATIFIEPWSTVEMGNEVRELALEEKHEVERILSELSVRVGMHGLEIGQSIKLAAEIDLALAKARYARKAGAIEAILTEFKEDNAGSGVLRLVDARHPLLGEKAVPLSVEIGRNYSSLVITGPNTGGKTVTLKTVGLLSLMTLAGLPIPVSGGSTIPLFDGIFADIGDEQSIEQTLSSFSWHMGNIIRIIGQATGKSMVLLDELGASTDPAEGSALARSILLYFLSRRAMTVATTHYGDLKAFAHTIPGLQNASLDFDPVTLAPTYHLTVGVPGGSNALATAARLGLDPEIINRARDMLSGGSQELEALLSDLATEKRKLEALNLEVLEEKKEVEQRNIELKDELQRLKSEEQRIVLESRDKVTKASAELHKLIREAESDLRKERTREKVEQAKKTLSAARDELKGELWQVKSDEAASDGSRIIAGDTVLLKDTDVRATVLSVSPESRQVEVQAGATRLSLSLDSVEKVAPAPDTGRVKFTPVPKELSKRRVSLELDLRGKRADEIEAALDSYINDASLANLSQVRIIHGIGTGTVRRIVRDFLAAHPLVKSFRSGGRDEGGDGATVVSF